MAVRVSGEVLGHLSSSSRLNFTLPNMHNLVEECGMRPLKLLHDES